MDAVEQDRRAGLVGGLVLAALVLALLAPFARADPPAGLTGSNAAWTDEGFNLANARQRVLFGEFATGDVDRSLTNGVYSAVAAGVFAVTRPRLAAGRAISMVAVAVAVLLLAAGLAAPLGAAAALLAAAALGGADLVLEYGRLALVEPTVVALLTAAFVLAVRAPWRPSPWAGAGLGLALAAAVSVKAVAVVPAAAMLAVVLAAALKRRHRAALVMGLVALGTALAAGLVWLVAVALPAAAGLGLAALVGRWRRIGRAARDALVIAALWGVGLWAVLGAGDYLPTHYAAPNRYVVPALPGLAVLAGFGLSWLAGGLGRHRAGVAAATLALAVATPGAVGYLSAATASGHQRERDQRLLAAKLPPHAVVFGAYAPTLLFDTRAEVVTAWPPAGANVDDPVGRFGVSHVLAADPADASDPIAEVPAFRDLHGLPRLAQVRWGGRTVGLYGVAASPASPAAR